ncbi:MAG: outer membrane protein assembly factor BamA, partial [Flavobacteriaceae bacterium]|nr:outer membrane protein assembly factor BamA [Flavobacteriaceae bacterium]
MKTYITQFLITLFLCCSSFLAAQTAINSDKTYIIGDVTVTGETSFSPQTVVTYSGLRKGDELKIPGEKIGVAIKKLWSSGLFSSIDLYVTRIEGDDVFLEIHLEDLPELNEVVITGVKKGKIQEILDENKLQPGVKVTENLVTTTKNYLEGKHKKKGFYNANVDIVTTE